MKPFTGSGAMRCIAPYFWLLTSPKARFTCFWFDRSKLNLSALARP
jgi:hypothetical protein